MKHLSVVALITLSACATPTRIYSSEVDKSAQSSKAVAEVSQCLQLRWAVSPITGPDGKVSFPLKNGFGQVLGLVTLTPNAEGTLLELRKTGQMLSGGDWKKCV